MSEIINTNDEKQSNADISKWETELEYQLM